MSKEIRSNMWERIPLLVHVHIKHLMSYISSITVVCSSFVPICQMVVVSVCAHMFTICNQINSSICVSSLPRWWPALFSVDWGTGMTSTPQWTTKSLLNKLEAFNQLFIVVSNQADREQLHHLNEDMLSHRIVVKTSTTSNNMHPNRWLSKVATKIF